MPDATPCSPRLSGTRSPRPLFRIAILALVKPDFSIFSCWSHQARHPQASVESDG